MSGVIARQVEANEVSWLESEFNTRWPWPRHDGFIAERFDACPFFVALDDAGAYLGHCHVRESAHAPFRERGIPETADLNVMPPSRRLGAASALLDLAEAFIAKTSSIAGIGVGLYDDYGPAQRLYTSRGYVLDGTGAWASRTSVVGGAVVTADDDLLVYLTKQLA